MTSLFKEIDFWEIFVGQSQRFGPETGDDVENAWTRENELAMGYILEALKDGQLVRIMHMEKVSEMWSKLITVNESTLAIKKTILIRERTDSKIKVGETAKEYIATFSGMILQLLVMNTEVDGDIQKVWLLKGLSK